MSKKNYHHAFGMYELIFLKALNKFGSIWIWFSKWFKNGEHSFNHEMHYGIFSSIVIVVGVNPVF